MFRSRPAFQLILALLSSAAPLCVNTHARQTSSDDPAYVFDRWETEDGLPENSATALAQTPDGFIWFGTFNGLVRFDGVHFTVFDQANTPSLPGAEILNLFADKSGVLWVSSTDGLFRFRNGTFSNVGRAAGWVGDSVRTFTQNKTGEILLTTFDGHLLEARGETLTELKQPPGATHAPFIGGADENEWWIVQSEFVGLWNGTEWLRRLTLPKLDWSAVGAGPAREGGLWILAGTDLSRIRNGAEVEKRKLPEAPGGFWSLHEDQSGNVWISTCDRGLVRISPGGEFRRWTKDGGLGWNNLRAIMEDAERNLWIGTGAGGLIRLKEKRFVSFAKRQELLKRTSPRSLKGRTAEFCWLPTARVSSRSTIGALLASFRCPGDNSVSGQRPLSPQRAGG